MLWFPAIVQVAASLRRTLVLSVNGQRSTAAAAVEVSDTTGDAMKYYGR